VTVGLQLRGIMLDTVWNAIKIVARLTRYSSNI